MRGQAVPAPFTNAVELELDTALPDSQSSPKLRLAFAKAHANEMWQADTLIGPYIQHAGTPAQSRLIAFLDDASRVCCHGQFFLAENVDTLTEALRPLFTNVACPSPSMSDSRTDPGRPAAPLRPLLPKRGKGLIIKHSYWRWPERNLAGNAIGFFVQVLEMSFHDAMRQITAS